MVGSFARALAALLCTHFLLTACSSDWFEEWAYRDATPSTLSVPAAKTVEVADLPPDAQAALRAVVLRLHGHDAAAVGAATEVSGSDLIAPEPSFTYDGFTVRRVKIIELSAAANAGETGTVRALLRFEDATGRAAAVSVAALYRKEAQGITLTEAAYRPLYAAHPRVELLIVPAEAVKAGLRDAADSYAELRALAERDAIAMRDPGSADAAAKDYVAIAFLRDRIGPGATLAMRLSDQRRGVRGFEEQTRYLAFEPGWGAALTPGAFALSAEKEFWIKVVYDPKGTVPGAGRGERVVGLYSTAPAIAAK
jgi:hypothetical protein